MSLSMGATETETAREVVLEYFDALARKDLERAGACWNPGSIDRLVGFADLIAPDDVQAWFGNMFAAVPDFEMRVTGVVAEGDQVAVRWQANGTFNGNAKFEGLAPNGATIELEGCDLLTVREGMIVSNHAYTNGMEFARQVGALPPQGSRQEKAMAALFNARTAAAKRLGRSRS